MEQIISKEELEKIMKIKGKVRGLSLKNYGRYILREHKEEGLKKVEEVTLNLGCPIKYEKLKAMSFYPLWWSVVTLVILEKIFHYDEQKFQEMGRFCFKFPNLLRIWAKYLVSLEKGAKSGPEMYKMMVTVGELTAPEYSKEKRYMVIRMKDFPIYPIDSPRIYCHFLTGYFCSALQMVTGKHVTGEEVKCVYKGNKYHEFLVKW